VKTIKVFLVLAVLACIFVSGCKNDLGYDVRYAIAEVFDNLIIKRAQIMTTHIEDTGIEVRATFAEPAAFGSSYADFNVEENWIKPYFTFVPEDMSAYTNAPPEINGIIMTKMKSKDVIDDEFGLINGNVQGSCGGMAADVINDETQGTCADVQEQIYASTFSLLSPEEKENYLAEGKSLSFIQDDRPGDGPGDNPITVGSNWLGIDSGTMITSDDDDNYFYEPPSLYVTIDNPIFDDGGGDPRFKGVRYCKLLSHQAILSWMLTKSFEDDPVLIAETTVECTDPRDRITSLGSCLFEFPLAGSYYCSDYTGSDFSSTIDAETEKCGKRPHMPDATLDPVFSPLPCSERTAEIEAAIPGYVGHTAVCTFNCMTGEEFIWNVYEEAGEISCGGNPFFEP